MKGKENGNSCKKKCPKGSGMKCVAFLLPGANAEKDPASFIVPSGGPSNSTQQTRQFRCGISKGQWAVGVRTGFSTAFRWLKNIMCVNRKKIRLSNQERIKLKEGLIRCLPPADIPQKSDLSPSTPFLLLLLVLTLSIYFSSSYSSYFFNDHI